VHFLAGKERTQEELFHVFNDLHSAGKQVVLSSDRPPTELGDLEARLRSRFGGGLVVEIHSPDRALREKLYARFLVQADVEPDTSLLVYLAERPVSSVREIAGMVHRLVAAAEVAGVVVTRQLAERELDGPGAARVPPPAAVKAVDEFFLDDEKVIWDWPEVGGRVIEEWR
jgi:chromosomal replication initiator protein